MRFFNLIAVFGLGLLQCLPTLAKLVNVTIDDQYGDPKTGTTISYFPADAWNLNTLCSGCNSTPDAQLTYMQSWHVGTFDLSASAGSDNGPATVLSAAVPFNGSAVYIYCVIAHFNTSSDGNSDMTFVIDGSVVGTFVQPTTKGPSYQYNYLVYQNTSLSPGPHNLTLYNGHSGGAQSLVILDYITYTFDDGTPPVGQSSNSDLASSKNKKIIVGAVVGSVGGLFVIALAIVLWSRYLRNKAHHPNDAIRAYAPRPHSRMFESRGSADWPGGPAYAAYANSGPRQGPSQSTLQTTSTAPSDSSHTNLSLNRPAPARYHSRGHSDAIALVTPPIHEEPGEPRPRTRTSRSDSKTTYPPEIPMDAPPAYLYQDHKEPIADPEEVAKRRRRSLRKPVPRLEDL